VKAGWTTKRLGEVCRTIQDGAHESPKVQFESAGPNRFLYITSKNIRNNYLDLGRVSYVERSFHDRIYPRCRPERGDVLLTKDGANTGQVALNSLAEPFSLLSSVCLIKTRSDVLLPAFLCYYIQSPSGLASITGQMTGAAIKRIILRDIKLAPIPVPPLPEQRRIVAVLDAAFEGIATAAANAERNLQNARDLFESHLSEVFSRRGEGWVERRLEEVCVLVNGRAYKKPEMLQSGKYPLLRVGNFFTNRDWYYSDLELEAEKYCDRGDLLYAWSASFGPRIWDGERSIYHYHIWKVLPRIEVVQLKFLFYLLQWDVEQIKQAQGTGTTMLHVSKGSMEARMVPIPPLALQLRMTETLDQLNSETQRLIVLYEQKQAGIAALKRSLLHQAFNGEL
jgi:type I restriction enzyme, S subunit